MDKTQLLAKIKPERLVNRAPDSPEMVRLATELSFFEQHPSIYNSINKLFQKNFKGTTNRINSFICYLVGLTDQNCDFEQPLNVRQDWYLTRYSPPDIDVDFEDNGPIYKYIIEKYGETRVANIGTYATWKIKGAIKSASKYCHVRIPYNGPTGIEYYSEDESANIITKSLPDFKDMISEDEDEEEEDFDLILRAPEMQQWVQQYPQVFEIARQIVEFKTNIGKHAAGIVISDVPIAEIVPLHKTKKKEWVTAYDMHDLEALGLLKMDILGVKTLKVVHKCLDLIKARRGYEFENIWNIEPNDAPVFNMLAQGLTSGIFQFEGWGITRFLKDMKPTSFYDLVASTALYRPGPMGNRFHEAYIERKQNPVKAVPEHPALNEILNETLGLFIYQEQIMSATRILGGFTYTESDEVRKVIGKKQMDKMPVLESKFVKRSGGFGVITEEQATYFWGQFEKFGSYAFNKSHAAAYTIISYITAFLKLYFPIEFFAALMSVELHFGNDKSEENLKRYQKEASEQFNIYFLPVDINKSKIDYAVERTTITVKDENGQSIEQEIDGIRIPFGSLKGVAGTAEREIVGNQPYKSFEDFIFKCDKCKNDVMEMLIKANAFASFGSKAQIEKDYKRCKGMKADVKTGGAKKKIPDMRPLL